jgi:hypothetical protein
MRNTIPFRSENVVTNAPSMVSSMLGRAALALALCLTTMPVVAVDLSSAAASLSLDMSSDVDSATLADLPLETLMRVAVSPSTSQPALAPAVSEIYALRYLAPSVDPSGAQETGSRQRVALFTKQAGGF